MASEQDEGLPTHRITSLMPTLGYVNDGFFLLVR